MKKTVFIVITAFILLGLIVALIALIIPAFNADDGGAQPCLAPSEFRSFSEFEAADIDAACYYIPSSLPDGYDFQRITMREDVYIAVTYAIDPATVNAEGLSSYGTERLTTLICEYGLYEDGSVAINGSYIPNGFKPVEYQGRTLYRYDDYDLEYKDGKATTSKRLIGYSVVFLEDGHCIYMHLPAIDTFENMIQYTNVVKVNIE